MKSGLTFIPTASPPLRLKATRRSEQGLSSYRHHMTGAFRPLFTDLTQHLADDQWLNMFANSIKMWFAYERKFLSEDSVTLLQYLHQTDLLDLQVEFGLDMARNIKDTTHV